MSEEFVTITVDGREMQAPRGAMLIEVTDKAGIRIPRFCYHEKLSIAANCRMCLVEVEKAPKPLPACATPVMDGMVVHTRSDNAREAQKSVMEFLLINHPLDCPICDQGGECELQDLAMAYGDDDSDYFEGKRVVFDKDIGPLIKTELTRCIHCTRCVRFGREIAGMRELGMTGRGEFALISTYLEKSVDSELSGNVIDVCPVGALTAKPSRYSARSWEMTQHAAVAPHDCVGSNIYIHTMRGELVRVVPRGNEAVNEVWISDRDRFSYEGVESDRRLTVPMVKQQGEWTETDWDTALEAAAAAVRRSLHNAKPAAEAEDEPAEAEAVDAGRRLAALIGPSSTLEEMYLLQKLLRTLGSGSIDHRLRQSDFSDQDVAPVMPWLGQTIESLEALDAALVIGSWTRKEQPMINHRLRKAAIHNDAKIHYLNARAFEHNYPVAGELVVAPQQLARELAAIAAVVFDTAGAKAPATIAGALSGAKPAAAHKAVAIALREAENATVLLGSQALMHPEFATLRALADAIAEQTDASFGYLTEGANACGAWLAGAVPHRGAAGDADAVQGMHVNDWFETPPATALLVNAEPDCDVADAPAMLASLRAADHVVALTAFRSDALESVADVLLPIATFAETSGTFVNAEGRWQSFKGACRPVGESRPAWKVLRVLGNLLDAEGFDYMSSEEVRAELKDLCLEIELDNHVEDAPAVKPAAQSSGLVRGADVPIYAVDALVRHAQPLQASHDATGISVSICSADAKKLGLDEETTRVVVRQGDQSTRLNLVIDDAIPAGSAWVPLGLKGSESLGRPFDEIAIESA